MWKLFFYKECILRLWASLHIAPIIGGVWDKEQHLLWGFLAFTTNQLWGHTWNSPQSRQREANLCAELHGICYFQHSAKQQSESMTVGSVTASKGKSLRISFFPLHLPSLTVVSDLLRFFPVGCFLGNVHWVSGACILWQTIHLLLRLKDVLQGLLE